MILDEIYFKKNKNNFYSLILNNLNNEVYLKLKDLF